jgi:hypothetical protein
MNIWVWNDNDGHGRDGEGRRGCFSCKTIDVRGPFRYLQGPY